MNKKKKRKKSQKKLEEQKNKQKQIITIASAIIFLILAVFLILNNSSDKPILKSEYKIGEEGYIDDIKIKLIDATYINNNTGIEISFEITNKRANTITITPDEYFVFYDINKVQIPNKLTNNNKIVKKNEKIIYKLQYDVTQKELYEIYFYSQIVENNIKFTFNSSDINQNILEEKDITPEKTIDEPK